MTDIPITLPPMPRAEVDEHNLQGGRLLYGLKQVQDYARAAVLADRAARDKDAENKNAD